MTKNKSQIKNYLADIIQGLLLIIWFLAAEASKMDVTLALGGGITIFGILAVFLVIRRYLDTKKELAELKGKTDIEKHKIFYNSTQSLITNAEKQSIERNAKLRTYLTLIRVFEKSSKNENHSKKEKETYAEVVNRLKDMQHSATE